MDSTHSIPTKGDSEVCVALYSEIFLQSWYNKSKKKIQFFSVLIAMNSNKTKPKRNLQINKVCHLGGDPQEDFKHS